MSDAGRLPPRGACVVLTMEAMHALLSRAARADALQAELDDSVQCHTRLLLAVEAAAVAANAAMCGQGEATDALVAHALRVGMGHTHIAEILAAMSYLDTLIRPYTEATWESVARENQTLALALGTLARREGQA